MPNPTSKILAEWAETHGENVKHWLRVHLQHFPRSDVLDIKHQLEACHENDPEFRDARMALDRLILRRLDGAERARVKAEDEAAITLHPDDQSYQRTLFAREILEALDG